MKAQIKSSGEVINVDNPIDSKNGTLWHVSGTQNCILEQELRFFSLGDMWSFIETWHPDYYHSDEIAWIDDLDCALDNECDDEKLSRIKSEWGETRADWERNKMELEIEVLSRSIQNYYRNLYGNATSEAH